MGSQMLSNALHFVTWLSERKSEAKYSTPKQLTDEEVLSKYSKIESDGYIIFQKSDKSRHKKIRTHEKQI